MGSLYFWELLFKGRVMMELTRVGVEHVIESGGYEKWYLDGQLHRLDGPAVVDESGGYKAWWVNDKLHRLDGPAIIHGASSKVWLEEGRIHRLDDSSITEVDEFEEWWVDGLRHRIDGPAITCVDEDDMWWLFGGRVSKENHALFAKLLSNNMSNEELPYDVLQVLFDEFIRSVE